MAHESAHEKPPRKLRWNGQMTAGTFMGLVAAVSSAFGSAGGGLLSYKVGHDLFVSNQTFERSEKMQAEMIITLREIRQTADDAGRRATAAEGFKATLDSIDRRLSKIEGLLMQHPKE